MKSMTMFGIMYTAASAKKAAWGFTALLRKKKWEKMGLVLEKELYSINGDMTPLASYLIKQVRYIPDNKRYTHSRNLAAPEITEPLEVTRYAESEISIPTGALLLYRSPYSRGTSQYVRY